MKNSKTAFSFIEISVVLLIIGILIAGVVSGSRLLSKSKLRSAQDLTRYSPIYNIGNLALWLEPTLDNAFVNQNSSTNIKDGDYVQTWKDLNPQLSFRNNAVQSDATNAARPKYIKSGINNLPVVRFDGATDYMLIPYLLNPQNKNFTIFVVINTKSGITDGSVLLSQQNGTGTGRSILVYSNTGKTINSFLGGVTFTGPVLTNRPQIIRLSKNQGTLYFSSNGSTATSSAVTAESADGKMVIGAGKAISSFFPADIAELIIFADVLETEDLKLVEQYLSKKWKIKLQ